MISRFLVTKLRGLAKRPIAGLALSALLLALPAAARAEVLNIATVNNGDNILMQKMTDDFKAANPDIDIKWVTLEENVLRQKLTVDIATKGGQFDVISIGTYETPFWSKLGWLLPLENLGADYDAEDIMPAIRQLSSRDGKLYGAPLNAESSMTMYRKDLFDKANLVMPDKPTWDFIAEAARKITDRAAGINGICLRGKPGWGENMALINTLAYSFGTQYFAEDWTPQFDKPLWKEALQFYVDLMRDAGPAGATSNGYNENLALFEQGKCGIWIDSTVSATYVTNPKHSTVPDKVGFALAPDQHGTGIHGNWLWAWLFAIPASSQKAEAAQKFISWATSKHYLELVGKREGWAAVPPGTRQSLYKNPEYLAVAGPFADATLEAMKAVTNKPPHTIGIFPDIAEYPAIGSAFGQQVAAALTGDSSVEDALSYVQALAVREMTKAGYIK